ncbi:hypothetical protein HMPREF3227_01168 [Corynebacterium sp. CMW7794]|nr:hypothetical protein HMPREF0307_00228 [Corynebacterium sp. DNF00584]KXI18346.1 hypothetical protein HMPREF3227_01168 [Corynebacterium sp. CMW7794]
MRPTVSPRGIDMHSEEFYTGCAPRSRAGTDACTRRPSRRRTRKA